MKLFFLKDDSLYKIFTTLEKTPQHTDLQIFIESENQFFKNPWRYKQIESILTKRHLTATFIAENDHQQHFFEQYNINHDSKKISRRRTTINMIYRFFFNIKKFHINNYENKNYVTVAIFGSELLIVIALGYFFYSLVMPKTTITLTPSYDINEIVYNFRYMYPKDIPTYPYPERHIIIPITTGSLDNITITHANSIDPQIDENKSQIVGTLRIINTTTQPINLLNQTQLFDDFGIEYIMTQAVNIPGSSRRDQSGIAYVTIASKNDPENNALISQYSGNIVMGHRLLITNLKQSRLTKQVYGELTEDITTRNADFEQFILFSDITQGQKQLYEEFVTKRRSFVTTDLVPEGNIILPYDDFIYLNNCNYQVVGEKNPDDQIQAFSGALTCDIQYAYIQESDIIEGIRSYINNRKTITKQLIAIQNEGISFFELLQGNFNEYIIPTRVPIIEAYDITTDHNNIIPVIMRQIIGATKAEALRIISQYPEIEKADIKISPRRYNTITTVQSRIFIKTL